MDFALDAVIDAIENNQIKNALNLCEKSIKKWPLSIEFKALQALALWYSGNESLAESNALSLSNRCPKDHFTISIIERVLEFSDNFKALSDLCENAIKDEYDERIAEKIYFCQLRLQNTGKLYSIATKLFNASKNQIYLYWAVVGLVLEIQNGGSDDKTILIELCKRTFQKIFKNHSIKLEMEHEKLGLMIDDLGYEISGLSQIKSDIPINTDRFDHIYRIIDSKPDFKDFDMASHLCLNYLNAIPYIDSRAWSLFLSMAKKAGWTNDQILHALSSVKQKRDERGINYASLTMKIEFPASIDTNLSEMLFEFCFNLISKPSTLSDAVHFLRKFNDEDRQKFYQKTVNHINSIESSEVLVDQALFLHLHRFLSVSFGYQSQLNTNTWDLLNNIYTNVDTLRLDSFYRVALYRCLVLIDDNPNDEKIIDILESYAQIFMDRYVFGLLLLILLLSKGNFERAYSTFKGLDIKCIQLDTLGYLVSDAALYALDFGRCDSIYCDSSSLYASNRNDTWGLICQSIENNSFVSVVEFFDFFRRLEYSVQFVSNELLFLKFNLLKLECSDFVEFMNTRKFHKALKVLHKEFSQLVDNRDFAIFDSVDPTGYLKSVAKSLTSYSVEEINVYRNIFYHLSKGIITTPVEVKNPVLAIIYNLMSSDFGNVEKIILLLQDISNALVSEFSAEIDKFKYQSLNNEQIRGLGGFLLNQKLFILVSYIKTRPLNQSQRKLLIDFYDNHNTKIITLAKGLKQYFGDGHEERSRYFNDFLKLLEAFSSKRHRIFSKALLTDYAVVEELDFEVTFDKLFHKIKKIDSSAWIGNFSGLVQSVLSDPIISLGNTIVAPLRAYRADKTEAIIISAPYFTEKGPNICGTSIIMTAMEYLKKMNFLSRDVIFVFARDKFSMEEFAESLLSPESRLPLEIPTNILAAINIEIDGKTCYGLDSLTLKYESEEITPFLDFVNTLTKIADFQGIDLRFDERKKQKIPKIAMALLRQYTGYINSFHNVFCKSKIDAVTIQASGRDYSEEHNNLQEFYKFMISSIRSFCNAIGHFQHETAIYFPASDNNYFEFADYIGPAILIMIPSIIMSILELYAISGLRINSKLAFEAAIESLSNYFRILALVFVSSTIFSFIRFSPRMTSFVPQIMIVMELLAIFLIRKFGPKLKYARLISGIILFIGSFAIMFTSLGAGLVLYSTAALLCFLISLSTLSNKLEILLTPFISMNLWFKVILQITGQETPLNLIKLWKNNYIILFIYPAILLLCCQIK